MREITPDEVHNTNSSSMYRQSPSLKSLISKHLRLVSCLYIGQKSVLLIEWALGKLASHKVHDIDVKVADGNNAVSLYEKYGFKMNAHILLG